LPYFYFPLPSLTNFYQLPQSLLFSEFTKGHKKTLDEFKKKKMKMKKLAGLMMVLGVVAFQLTICR